MIPRVVPRVPEVHGVPEVRVGHQLSAPVHPCTLCTACTLSTLS
jgi:hypothetical protein